MCKYCEALQEDMEEIILAKNGYCSLTMKFEHERDNIVIDSFILKAAEFEVVGFTLYVPSGRYTVPPPDASTALIAF